MTRLEQALRWWRNNDLGPLPERHFIVLRRAGMIRRTRYSGYEDMPVYGLTAKGKRALAELPSGERRRG